MSKTLPPVLIVTLPLQVLGGVAAKARLLADVLRSYGRDVSFATYAARQTTPELNVSFAAAVLGRKPDVLSITDGDGYENVVVGCAGPELEFPYTAGSDLWTEVSRGFTRIVAVGGSPLIATPLVSAGIPHFLWCADDLKGDREARHHAMSWPLQVADRLIVQPRLRSQQDCVMHGDEYIFGVSKYTVDRLRKFRPERPDTIERLSIPVDSDFFRPPVSWLPKQRIGFAGRIGDPRKDAGLLLDTLRHVLSIHSDATLQIAGPKDDRFAETVARESFGGRIEICGELSRENLRAFYQGLDVFVIPSQREGLAIVGLEAMACGVPVVSTRCGGPEDYVVDDVTGFLASSKATALAEKVNIIIQDSELRARMSLQARCKVEAEFSIKSFTVQLDSIWRRVWGEGLIA